MRSSLLLAALAAGSANAYVKRVYVTDWTTVTVTKTVTAPAVTETVSTRTVSPVQQSQVVVQTSTAPAPVETSTAPPAPVETSSHTGLDKKSTIVVPESMTAQPPANSPSPPPVAQPQPQTTSESTSWFTSAWTSTIEPSSSTLATAVAATTPSSTPVNAYQQAILYNHNIHRSNHSAPSVDWSSDLESSARALASRCVYEHDTSIAGGGYGQNIGYGVEENQIGVMITDLMYNDEIGYFPTPFGQASPSMTYFEQWGHFSQIVWKGTTHVGCATVVCNGLGNVDSSSSLPFTVCNYSPPGNYDGEYADNVLAPQGQPVFSVA